MEAVTLLAADSPLAVALERGRERYNARYQYAKRGGQRVDPSSLLAHLASTVAPIVEAIPPSRLDAVVEALFDLSLELLSREIIGSPGRHPLVLAAWRDLLPRLTVPLSEAPLRVAAAVTNAAHNLEQEPIVRGTDWLASMADTAPLCQSVDELLLCGQVLAWRSGMAHLRESAVAVARTLRTPLLIAMLGTTDSLERPWPGPDALRFVGTVGGFRGFGGVFLRPPRVVTSGRRIWAIDEEAAFTLHADLFGRTLVRAGGTPPSAVSDATLEADGTLTFCGLRARLPEIAGASSLAAAGSLVAVAFSHSHRIALAVRTGGVA